MSLDIQNILPNKLRIRKNYQLIKKPKQPNNFLQLYMHDYKNELKQKKPKDIYLIAYASYKFSNENEDIQNKYYNQADILKEEYEEKLQEFNQAMKFAAQDYGYYNEQFIQSQLNKAIISKGFQKTKIINDEINISQNDQQSELKICQNEQLEKQKSIKNQIIQTKQQKDQVIQEKNILKQTKVNKSIKTNSQKDNLKNHLKDNNRKDRIINDKNDI